MSDYIGVYVFMEKIKIGPNRVDIAKLGPGDNAEPEISGGYIIAKDKVDPEDQMFSTSRGLSLVFKDPSGPNLTQAQKDWIRDYVNAFEAVLYGGSFADPVNGYAKYIDVGSFIDNHILVELTKNIDGFRLSTYFHKDRSGKLVMGPVWDYDLSLGNANYNDGWNTTGWYYQPARRRRLSLLAAAVRRSRVQAARTRTAGSACGGTCSRRTACWASSKTMPRCSTSRRPGTTTAGRPSASYVWPNWFIAKTYREEIVWMQGWIADRLAWMDGQIAVDFAPAPPAFNRQGGQVESGIRADDERPGADLLHARRLGPPHAGGACQCPGGHDARGPRMRPKRVLVPAGPVNDAWQGGRAFDDSAWTLVTGGPARSATIWACVRAVSSVSTSGPQMYGLRTSCYIRVPFSFTGDLRNVAGLTLKIRYNDGFVAYLNGVEIARRNFTGTARLEFRGRHDAIGRRQLREHSDRQFCRRAAVGQQRPGDPGPECLGAEPGLPDLGGACGRRIRRAGDSHAGQ